MLKLMPFHGKAKRQTSYYNSTENTSFKVKWVTLRIIAYLKWTAGTKIQNL